jgi:hypothetical protein
MKSQINWNNKIIEIQIIISIVSVSEHFSKMLVLSGVFNTRILDTMNYANQDYMHVNRSQPCRSCVVLLKWYAVHAKCTLVVLEKFPFKVVQHQPSLSHSSTHLILSTSIQQNHLFARSLMYETNIFMVVHVHLRWQIGCLKFKKIHNVHKFSTIQIYAW